MPSNLTIAQGMVHNRLAGENDTMYQTLTFIVFLIAVGAICVIHYLKSKEQERRIEEYLRSRGATDIIISKAQGIYDRDTYTFDVEYVLQGQHCRNSCKIHATLMDEGDLYWRDPL